MKWVPISYCQFCIENNCTDAGKLFCYLKYHSDGIVDKSILKKAERYFDVSDRTIKRWLKQAKKHRWITSSDKSLFLMGWQYLFNRHDFLKKACYQFRKKDLNQFKTFCYAAVISYMAKRTQVKRAERLRTRRSTNERSLRVSAWVPMAAIAIAKTLTVPESTARKYRNLAAEKGYFKKKENTRRFHLNVRELKQMRKLSHEADQSLFVKNGVVLKQYPDEIQINPKRLHSPKRFFLKTKYQQGVSDSMPHILSNTND